MILETHSRILIIKPSSLGDVIHTLPLVHALKRCRPGCHIGWVVQQASASLLRHDSTVDTVHEIDVPSTSDPQAGRGAYGRALCGTVSAWRDLRRQLRVAPYDLVLDLHASWRSALFALLNPGGCRIGFADAREGNTLIQHEQVPVSRPMHALEKNNLFAAHLGCPVQEEDLRLPVGEGPRQQVDDFLAKLGQAGQQRLVCLNPTARWASKFWTVAGWAELADLLAQEAGATVLFGGSPSDLPYIERIVAAARSTPIVAAGRLDLAGTAALLQRIDVYVGLDSGPMHMAAMAGRPVVAMFGPTNPELVGPYGPGHRVLRRGELACLGCRRRQCPAPICLHGITAQSVFAAVREVSPWND
ncbi:MAG: ADP-heptose--LPS heptosyltransferase [Desulfobulbaceae bacterium A2]|nr:MAG: ADP-heptose--LPS heptosyltransferase [Desulfobulbaceae bacterium A2]